MFCIFLINGGEEPHPSVVNNLSPGIRCGEEQWSKNGKKKFRLINLKNIKKSIKKLKIKLNFKMSIYYQKNDKNI
jgi:hypothetical protein